MMGSFNLLGDVLLASPHVFHKLEKTYIEKNNAFNQRLYNGIMLRDLMGAYLTMSSLTIISLALQLNFASSP